jgi:hypothetical protein
MRHKLPPVAGRLVVLVHEHTSDRNALVTTTLVLSTRNSSLSAGRSGSRDALLFYLVPSLRRLVNNLDAMSTIRTKE